LVLLVLLVFVGFCWFLLVFVGFCCPIYRPID
jgi:hypothetical protein